MFFSRRIIIIGIGVLVLIAAGWLVWRKLGTATSTNTTTPGTESATDTSGATASLNEVVGSPTTSADATAVEVPAEVALKNLSSMFTERYGTYSTDANGQNIKDVSPLMTAVFGKQVVAAVTKPVNSAVFYGVTTRVLMADIITVKGDHAIAEVKTQRQENFTRTDEPRLSYSTLRLTFLRAGKQWLVDGAVWK